MTELTLALLQAAHLQRTTSDALSALDVALAETAGLGASVLVTPELFLSGYGNAEHTRTMYERQDGRFLHAAAGLAAKHGVGLVCGYPESADGRYFNSAAVINSAGKLIHNYRKANLANDYERSCFESGADPTIFEFAGIRCAVLICYDVEFPEMARRAAQAGAELLIVPTALTSRWRIVAEAVIPTRAYENGVFVAYCNFAAPREIPEFGGLSTICGPDGQSLVRAGVGPEMVCTRLNNDRIAEIRSELHFLRDLRRIGDSKLPPLDS